MALHSGVVEVGADGTATVSFDMPDFAGTVRVMAMAWSQNGVGHASTDVVVRDPVVVTLSPPRFLRVDDTSRLLVEIANVAGPAGTYTVSLETGEKRWLLAPQGKLGRDVAPSISPDGGRLAFLRCTGTSTCDVYTAWIRDDFHTVSEPRRLTFDERFANSPVWLAGGKEFLWTSERDGYNHIYRYSSGGDLISQLVGLRLQGGRHLGQDHA